MFQLGRSNVARSAFLLSIFAIACHELSPGRVVTAWWEQTGHLAASGLAYDDRAGGRAEGEWCYWWPTGQLQAYGEFHHGRQHGPWVFWLEDGTVFNRNEPPRDHNGAVIAWRFPAEAPFPNNPEGSAVYGRER